MPSQELKSLVLARTFALREQMKAEESAKEAGIEDDPKNFHFYTGESSGIRLIIAYIEGQIRSATKRRAS